jgi:hypothetical protein
MFIVGHKHWPSVPRRSELPMDKACGTSEHCNVDATNGAPASRPKDASGGLEA